MKKTQNPPVFPRTVIKPVYDFLTFQLKKLTRQKKQIESTDPFHDLSQVNDHAAPDAMAEEQVSHVRTVVIEREISRRIIQTRRALTRIKVGKYGICAVCGNMIDTDRLMIYPEATLCISCEKKKEKKK